MGLVDTADFDRELEDVYATQVENEAYELEDVYATQVENEAYELEAYLDMLDREEDWMMRHVLWGVWLTDDKETS